MKKPILERFFKHIKFADTGCWIWKIPQATGRCQFWDFTRQVRAHNFSYQYFEHKTLEPGYFLTTTCGIAIV